MLAIVLAALAGLPPITAEQALELQRVRVDVTQWAKITCQDGSCVSWDERLRVWRFARPEALTAGLRSDDTSDPFGVPWTNYHLAHYFPELEPRELALDAMYQPVAWIWSELVTWLAEEPSRLALEGEELWRRFVAAHPDFPPLKKQSPWRRPYAWRDLAWLGATPEALGAAVTIKRCDALVKPGMALQAKGHPLTVALLEDAAGRAALLDVWGSPLGIVRMHPSSGQVQLGTLDVRLAGVVLVSAGPDRRHGTADDVSCGDARRMEGPAKLTPYGYRPRRRGPYDQAIDDAIVRRNLGH